MKIHTTKEEAWTDNVVTVTLNKRELAALFQVAGSRRACLQVGSPLLTQLITLAKAHGIEGYEPIPALENLVKGLDHAGLDHAA